MYRKDLLLSPAVQLQFFLNLVSEISLDLLNIFYTKLIPKNIAFPGNFSPLLAIGECASNV